MVGHKLLIDSFKSLVASGRLGHGYIFYGSEGVGKKLFARALASYLETKEFCAANRILNDLLTIQPDDESTIGIGQVREIRSFLSRRPNVSQYRTVILNNAESLTAEAQNALLKIAEEPPVSGLLILIVRDPEVLRETLISRFNKIYFSTIKKKEIEDWLEGTLNIKDAKGVAERSMGCPGLALKMLEDEKFQTLLKTASRFLKIGASERKDFLKELVDDENFDLGKFLDAITLQITNSVRMCKLDNLSEQEKGVRLWHRVLELKKNASYFNLNPRIQLQALLESRR